MPHWSLGYLESTSGRLGSIKLRRRQRATNRDYVGAGDEFAPPEKRRIGKERDQLDIIVIDYTRSKGIQVYKGIHMKVYNGVVLDVWAESLPPFLMPACQ